MLAQHPREGRESRKDAEVTAASQCRLGLVGRATTRCPATDLLRRRAELLRGTCDSCVVEVSGQLVRTSAIVSNGTVVTTTARSCCRAARPRKVDTATPTLSTTPAPCMAQHEGKGNGHHRKAEQRDSSKRSDLVDRALWSYSASIRSISCSTNLLPLGPQLESDP
jgi:hypothetical protein